MQKSHSLHQIYNQQMIELLHHHVQILLFSIFHILGVILVYLVSKHLFYFEHHQDFQ